MLLGVIALAGTCGDGAGISARCDGVEVRELGRLDGRGPSEGSGLVVSSGSDVLWTHNDRGNPPELFAVATTGESLGKWPIMGVDNTDWEDLSITADGTHLVIADIGDNRENRRLISAHVVPIPDPTQPIESVEATTSIEWRYPDGPHDAEAMLIDPRPGGIAAVVTKGDHADLYTAGPVSPDGADGAVGLRSIGTVWSNAEVRAGAVSPDGSLVALRTTERIRLWQTDHGTLDSMASWPSCQFDLDQKRGEGLAFVDPTTLLAIGEGDRSAIVEISLPPIGDAE